MSARDDLQLHSTAVSSQTTVMQRLSEDIREVNLQYLLLAQQMVRLDREEALFRLGLSAEAADLIASLSNSQLIRISSTSNLLSRFRFDDEFFWQLLCSAKKDDSITRMHVSILMASRTATEIE